MVVVELVVSTDMVCIKRARMWYKMCGCVAGQGFPFWPCSIRDCGGDTGKKSSKLWGY